MKKEEILAMSREDNRDEDEREKQLRMNAVIPAFIGMGVIGITLTILEVILLDTVIIGKCIHLMIMGSAATSQWYLALILKKKAWYISAACLTYYTIRSTLQVIDAFCALM